MKIEILYFEGCPNHEPTVQRVRQVVGRLGIDVSVVEVEVTPDDDPAALKFLGSPTVLINGRDIDPACRENASYGFGCRTFAGAGMPADSLIERAIREAQDDECNCCNPAPRNPGVPMDIGTGGGTTKNRSGLYSGLGAAGAAVLSSACCWLPLLLLAFGLSVGGAAGFFESVRPYLLVAASTFLGMSFYLAYFRKPACKPGDTCAVPNAKLKRFNRLMLWVATAFVIAFALFPSYSAPLFRAVAGNASTPSGGGDAFMSAADATYRLRIEGMGCEGCAAGLQAALANVPGVTQASVSYEEALARITADSSVTEEVLRRTVAEMGFAVTSVSVSKIPFNEPRP